MVGLCLQQWRLVGKVSARSISSGLLIRDTQCCNAVISQESKFTLGVYCSQRQRGSEAAIKAACAVSEIRSIFHIGRTFLDNVARQQDRLIWTQKASRLRFTAKSSKHCHLVEDLIISLLGLALLYGSCAA